MPSPILARADALMQRRRQNTNPDDLPVLTDAIDNDDDVPVLFDIETVNSVVAAEVIPDLVAFVELDEPTPQVTEELPSSLTLDAGIRDILAHELARRVEQRLTAELPHLIESTVRDFLAEQEMIAALQPRD